MMTPESHEYRASRACVECRMSKTKCNWPADMGVGKCQRCLRSRRVCTLADRGTKKRRAPNRVGQLEDKIDGIMSILNASQELQKELPLRTPTAPEDSTRQRHVPSAPSSIDSHRENALGNIEIIPGSTITVFEADRLLHLYRNSYSHYFPFVPIPLTTPAAELYSARPLLFRVIMHIVAPQSYDNKREFIRWFREHIAKHVLIEQEKKLEILQAIILFIAWQASVLPQNKAIEKLILLRSDFHFFRGSEATNLIQLAIGQVVDLGLSQPFKELAIPPNLLHEVQRAQDFAMPPKHDLDDMRSMLGCFFLCSTISAMLRRMSQFPCTNYLTTCCAELSRAQEHQSDQFLVALVQMQRLACRVGPSMPSPEINGVSTVEFSMSMFITMSTTCKELESLKNNLPQELQNNFFFAVTYSGTLMRLYEPVIHTCGSVLSGDITNSTSRTEALWHCLEATKQYFETLTMIPVEKLTHLPFPYQPYLSFGMITASWLLFQSDADWDVSIARKSFDIAAVVGRLSARYEESDRLGVAEQFTRNRHLRSDGLSMSMLHRDKLTWYKSWYLANVLPRTEFLPESSGLDSHGLGDADLFPAEALDPAFWVALMNENSVTVP